MGIIVVCLMIGAQSVYAETAYQSGFKHGLADGKLDSVIYCANAAPGCTYPPDRTYIHQPGNGFDHHTTAFVDGYIKGWCLVHHGGGIESNDDPEPTLASFDCDQGLGSAFPHPSDWAVHNVSAREPVNTAVIFNDVPQDGFGVYLRFNSTPPHSSLQDWANVTRSGQAYGLLGGFYAGNKITISMTNWTTGSRFVFPDRLPGPVLDQKTIKLGETGGVVELSLARVGVLQSRFDLVSSSRLSQR